MSRPTKLNAETHTTIINAITAGAYIETAAAHAGIHKDTLYDWLKKGRQHSQQETNGEKLTEKQQALARFSDAIEKALGDAELRDIAIISKAAAEGAWQASAWRLERKFPDRWGKRSHVELTGRNGGHIQVGPAVDLTQLSTEEIQTLHRIIQKSQNRGELTE
jgi:transposase